MLRRTSPGARARLCAGLVSLLAGPALALDLSVRLEAGGTAPVTLPQSAGYGVGPGLGVHLALGVAPFLDGQASLGYSLWPPLAGGGKTGPASLIAAGLGLRLKRPLPHAVVLPWLDAGGFYSRTGALDRAGATVGAGLSFRTSERSTTLFGPFVRYQRVLALSGELEYTSRDADLVLVGLSFEFLSGATDEPTAPPPPPPTSSGPSDRDGDGLLDSVDRCPDAAGPAALSGCPDGDGDGVNDLDDKCPRQPGTLATGGCPADEDQDRDGVKGAEDRCPSLAGPLKTHGCPDADGDGVADPEDACPQTAGLAEDRGCPRYKQIVITSSKIELLQKIFFAFGTTSIMPKSFPLLDEVAQALTDRTGFCLRIEGHTDNKGAADANLKLSSGRATAVMTYLVQHGTAAARLEAKGYGQTLPMDDNGTATGRENNRRVEFVIVQCRGGP